MPLFTRIRDFTRVFTAPEGWDEKTQGVCQTVWVRDDVIDGVHYMFVSAEFTPEERAMMDAGEPVLFGISGIHFPVCAIKVGDHKE